MKIYSLEEVLHEVGYQQMLYGTIPPKILKKMVGVVKKDGEVIGFKLNFKVKDVLIEYDKKGNLTNWRK